MSRKLKQASVASVTTGGKTNPRRLLIFDRTTGTKYLVDTGADISVTPPHRTSQLTPTQLRLQAANGTVIDTYGDKPLELDIWLRRPIRWILCIANVPYPIIAADLIHEYGLLVDLRRGCIIDPNSGSRSTSSYATAPITAITSLHETNKFTSTLRDVPELLGNPSNRTASKHSVKHYIPTTGPPCVQRVRQLRAECLKVAEEEFRLMVELGHARPSNSP
ncbi:uncharacterized protein LOC118751772 [Rhagoletis pomonella]|uniref:uncharacterized protein LOC118751687 n=1 Tax=Rhagoletis pomonella TaxID=28610 RepID=UPI00177C117A|nr:uncharacterized protein LOC118751687 [Rhagoletis pomonella]XP_036342483.1 uncharacterized protein LOC118751772 [Rhagoletis pomonella]